MTAPHLHATPSTSLLQRMFQPFWVVPAVVMAVALLSGLLLPLVDRAVGQSLPYAFLGGPEAARSILSSIAGAMMSVAGLVFSITIVVLQLASSQFTPRALGEFLSNRTTQLTMGTFLGAFTYALTVMRVVVDSTDSSPGFVPRLSVTASYLFVLASLVMFLIYIRQITRSVQVQVLIRELGDRTVGLIVSMYPDSLDDQKEGEWRRWGHETIVTMDDHHGHVIEIDEASLVSFAQEHSLSIELLVKPGNFVTTGTELARIFGEVDEDTASQLRSRISLASERTMAQDPTFGLRQLVDIADRALSPGVNDPTTTRDVLNELHRVLRVLITRHEPAEYLSDDEGVARLRRSQTSVPDTVAWPLEEIRHYAETSPNVLRHVESIIADLMAAGRPEHTEQLQRSLDREAEENSTE